MNRSLEFKCKNCGCMRYSDVEGSGTDKFGDFTEYWCEDCEQLTRMYDDEEN